MTVVISFGRWAGFQWDVPQWRRGGRVVLGWIAVGVWMYDFDAVAHVVCEADQ